MGKVLERQAYHLLVSALLGGVLYWAVGRAGATPGRALGMSTEVLVLLSWTLAGVFQFGVALVWRLQLHFGSIERRLGRAGFVVFAIVFLTLLLSRMLLIIPISQADQGSLPIDPVLFWIAILVPLPLILWACQSVLFYFGLVRAIGADHFDPRYREGTLETRGIFKHVRNPMYVVILLLLYHPGLYYQSRLGLIVAVCQHAFVWAHYFCTEKPDLREIYGDGARRG